MSGRSRQKLGVLLLILLVMLVVSACGGGDEETTTTSLGPTTTVASSGSGEPANELIGTIVSPTKDTPAEFADVCGVKPIVVLFYVPGAADDASVLESLNRLDSSFDHYEFLVYDYKIPDAYGDLSTLLKVGYPPQLVMIDKTGTIRSIWNGYVDEGTLNQELVDLGRF